MLDIKIDAVELTGLIAGALGVPCRLVPLNLRCTYPCYRGELSDGRTVFVKVGPVQEWNRTRRVVEDLGDCALVPKLLVRDLVRIGEWAVFVSEWRDVVSIPPEDMTDAQIDDFVKGCCAFSSALQNAHDFTPIAESPLDPTPLHEKLVGYVRRHRLVGRLLRPLTELPARDRVYEGRELCVVHGDFHSRNFGFKGDRLRAVFDFDKLTQGLACEDFVHAFVERFACMGLSAAGRARLKSVFVRAVNRCPWSAQDLVVSCNVLRLRHAGRRIEKHPNAFWTAIDIWRRDRLMCGFIECLEERHV